LIPEFIDEINEIKTIVLYLHGPPPSPTYEVGRFSQGMVERQLIEGATHRSGNS
jgi:hypothetical protein